MSSECLQDNKNISMPPDGLQELQVQRGVLGEIKPWAPGLILVAIGKQNVILPAELEKQVRKHAGHKVTVLRCGRYSIRRTRL